MLSCIAEVDTDCVSHSLIIFISALIHSECNRTPLNCNVTRAIHTSLFSFRLLDID